MVMVALKAKIAHHVVYVRVLPLLASSVRNAISKCYAMQNRVSLLRDQEV